MNALGVRKKLLLLESELNRTQLVQEYVTLADDAHALGRQAGTVGSVVVTALKFLGDFQSKESTSSAAKFSWWQVGLKAAQLAASLWSSRRQSAKKIQARRVALV